MSKITKQDVIDAYKGKKRKRSQLLFEYYYSDYFSGDYSAEFIAEKISADLGIPISANMVRIARHRVGKSAHSSQPQQELKEQLRTEILQSLKQETNFSNNRPGTYPEQLWENYTADQLNQLTSEELYKIIESESITVQQLERVHELLEKPSQKLVVYSQIKIRKEKQEPISKPRRKLFE